VTGGSKGEAESRFYGDVTQERNNLSGRLDGPVAEEKSKPGGKYGGLLKKEVLGENGGDTGGEISTTLPAHIAPTT